MRDAEECKRQSNVPGIVPAHVDLGLPYDFIVTDYFHNARGLDMHNRAFLVTAAGRDPDAVDNQVERFVATASRRSFLNLPRGVNLTTAGLGAQQRHAVVSGKWPDTAKLLPIVLLNLQPHITRDHILATMWN
eukprot:gene10116-4758_t